jgi:hypothetical protein
LELSYHGMVLLLGVAITGLALVGFIAVGPYGRRGVRTTLAAISALAFFASAAWLTNYLGLIEERRAIETRLSELRGRALNVGSPLACLEQTGGAVDAACAQKLFASPETLAAANSYISAQFDLLLAASRYSGPRSPQFNDAIGALETSLQQDTFGIAANVLVMRNGCTAERCEALAAFQHPARLRTNIRERIFEANVARHAGAWREKTPSTAASAPASSPASGETRAPIPEKYSLPSSDSIPPVSIMNDEPAERSPPTPPRQPAAASSRAEPALPPTAPPATPPSSAEKQGPGRAQKTRPSAPLAITPAR